MYLTKLILDTSHHRARRDIADAYEMHRTLSRAFVPESASPPGRFLWRMEHDGSAALAEAGRATVLVQSAEPGQWQHWLDQPGYAHSIFPNKHVDLAVLLRQGRGYRFRIVANPTVTRAGKRWGLMQEEQQQQWLARQGERNGFRLLESARTGSSRLSVKQGRKGHRISVQKARFDGFLEATDVAALSRALLNGIGHAKALGLGMLSLAPARI